MRLKLIANEWAVGYKDWVAFDIGLIWFGYFATYSLCNLVLFVFKINLLMLWNADDLVHFDDNSREKCCCTYMKINYYHYSFIILYDIGKGPFAPRIIERVSAQLKITEIE